MDDCSSSLDLKLILSFANSYRNLYQKGEIDEEQLNQVLDLIENYQSYAPDQFKNKLQSIFPGTL
ncbi:MAG: hypothetical protein ACOCQE_01210 [Halanaerobium sp.]|jgi:hypothetical protein